MKIVSNKEFGKIVKDKRVAKRMRQSDIERRTGMTRAALSRVECGGAVSSRTIEMLRIFLSIEEYPSEIKKHSATETLCWKCQNACGGCSWADKGTPVDGWNAKFRPILYAGKLRVSYFVYECPKFKADKPRPNEAEREELRIQYIKELKEMYKHLGTDKVQFHLSAFVKSFFGL